MADGADRLQREKQPLGKRSRRCCEARGAGCAKVRSEIRSLSFSVGPARTPLLHSSEYDKYYAAQLDELAQGYGNLEEFGLDGAGSAGHVYNFPRIIEELRTYQPNTLVFADVGLFEYGDIRWVGNETRTA